MMMMMMMPECLMLNIMYVWFAGTTNYNKSIATFDSITRLFSYTEGWLIPCFAEPNTKNVTK